jgi:Na+/H+ antiporter NhaC
VAQGGDTIPRDEGGSSMIQMDMEEDVKPTSALNVIVPLLSLVVGTLIFDCDLTYGCIIAIFVQMIMYLSQRLMKPTKYFDDFMDGAKSMFPLMILVTFAFSLSNVNGKLGFFEYMISTIGAVVPASLLPCMTFLLVALATFATAVYWSMQVISVPIFLPLASALGVNPSIIVAAIMSGVTFGCCYCFYSDNLIMTAAGSQVSTLTQSKTSTTYVVPCAVLSFICYLITGFIF